MTPPDRLFGTWPQFRYRRDRATRGTHAMDRGQHTSRKPLPSRHVQRAAHPFAAPVQHVGVDHCRAHVTVTEQFLHRANVVPGFQQVRGKRVPEGVAGGRLRDSRLTHRCLYRSLQPLFVHMVSTSLPGTRINRQPRCGNTYCHPVSCGAAGYFRARALGR